MTIVVVVVLVAAVVWVGVAGTVAVVVDDATHEAIVELGRGADLRKHEWVVLFVLNILLSSFPILI